ncbi:MAG: TRAP transporter small permease subunit [Arhodomonas sp.]|nr:TRAP transporter small permease subunit [Arhodomonas sp.]
MAAALCLAAIAVLILAQTVGRVLGFSVPSANELAGFCVAASTFLALAHTLNHGGHIRAQGAHRAPAGGYRTGAGDPLRGGGAGDERLRQLVGG